MAAIVRRSADCRPAEGCAGWATDAAKALAQQMRSTRALVLTDRIVTARSGRPLRVRARLVGSYVGEPQVFLSYNAQHGGDDADYIRVPMDRSGGGYEAWLRPS